MNRYLLATSAPFLLPPKLTQASLAALSEVPPRPPSLRPETRPRPPAPVRSDRVPVTHEEHRLGNSARVRLERHEAIQPRIHSRSWSPAMRFPLLPWLALLPLVYTRSTTGPNVLVVQANPSDTYSLFWDSLRRALSPLPPRLTRHVRQRLSAHVQVNPRERTAADGVRSAPVLSLDPLCPRRQEYVLLSPNPVNTLQRSQTTLLPRRCTIISRLARRSYSSSTPPSASCGETLLGSLT